MNSNVVPAIRVHFPFLVKKLIAMNYIKTFVLCAPQTDGISIPERSSAALGLYFSTKTNIPCTVCKIGELLPFDKIYDIKSKTRGSFKPTVTYYQKRIIYTHIIIVIINYYYYMLLF